MKFIVSYILSLIICSNISAQDLSKGKWIDLTHNYDENTIYWPTAGSFKHDTVYQGVTEKGYYYSAYAYTAQEHGGTHLDAPIHFCNGKKSIEEIPIERLMGDAVVINVSETSAKNSDYQFTVEDILNWEKTNGKIPENSIILFFTGYGKYWPDRNKYMGTDKLGQEGVDNLHFPGLHPETAAWLVKERKIIAVGLDTPSIDFGQSKMFETHQILCANNLSVFENVANLDKLPAKGSFVIALPMKIKDGSGAPLRIVALVK